jgi:hypothetical protein
MVVNSHNIEFGYELISVLPYAYHLHKEGKLTGTVSGNDTDCLYYFSPDHKINPEQRSWYRTPKVKAPNIDIHKPYLRKEQFLAPPLKEVYANDEFKWDKETIVICNRHNIEWLVGPINFFDLKTLGKLFELLQDKYQIVYINIEGRPELYDNSPPISMGDYELLKRYPKVINIHDIETDYSFNELQLRIFANCSKFITMNGGHSILTSYFGGENIIMSKRGTTQTKEIHHAINSFYRWYNEFGDQRIVHVEDENNLIKQARCQWVNKEPIVNILVRTCNRPMYFKQCIQSITEQTYRNINIFVAVEGRDYTVPYPVYPMSVTKTNSIPPIVGKFDYGVPFHSNLYLNDLHKKVKEGIIIYLDDDDILSQKTTVAQVVKEYKKGNDLVLWRVKIGKRVVPKKENFGNKPVCCDISGIGFAFDAKYKKDWEPYKRGDYRLVDEIYKVAKVKWIDKILSEAQNGAGAGNRKDMVIKENEDMKAILKIKIINNKFRGQKLKYSIGDVLEMSSSKARQFIKHGIAVDYEADKEKNAKQLEIKVKKPVKKKQPEKLNKVIEPKKVVRRKRKTKK